MTGSCGYLKKTQIPYGDDRKKSKDNGNHDDYGMTDSKAHCPSIIMRTR